MIDLCTTNEVKNLKTNNPKLPKFYLHLSYITNYSPISEGMSCFNGCMRAWIESDIPSRSNFPELTLVLYTGTLDCMLTPTDSSKLLDFDIGLNSSAWRGQPSHMICPLRGSCKC